MLTLYSVLGTQCTYRPRFRSANRRACSKVYDQCDEESADPGDQVHFATRQGNPRLQHSHSHFHVQNRLVDKVQSWFKNGTIDGPIVALHPGSRIHWFHMLDDPRYEDFEYTYLTDNIFQYLGNGFSTKEGPGKDIAWYFDDSEEGYRNY